VGGAEGGGWRHGLGGWEGLMDLCCVVGAVLCLRGGVGMLRWDGWVSSGLIIDY
jgi:hypothetical protein